MRHLRIYPMRGALLTLLALAAVALLGCVQAEANKEPPLSGVPEPVLMATAVPTLPPAPTPTPTPLPTTKPTASRLNPELLLPQINSAMATVRSFHAEGSWIVGEPGRSDSVAVVTQFSAEVDLQGDSRLVFTGRSEDSSFSNNLSFEVRQVDGITYAREPRGGRWSVEEEGEVSFLQQATFQAALSGRLVLEDMRLEQVISTDWGQVYRITGSAPNDPEADQVIILVDPEEMLILELELKGHVSSTELGNLQPQPHLDVRFSRFNEPVEIPTPKLVLVPAPAPETGLVIEAGPGLESGPEIEVLQQFLQNSNDVSSFRANMNLVMEAEGEVITVWMDLEQGKDGRARLNMELDMDGPTRMEMIIDPPDIYLKTEGEGWQRLSGEYWEGMGSEAIPSGTELFANPFVMDQVLWQSFTVKSLGDEEVNGVVAEHLVIEVNLQDFWDQLIHEWNEQFAENMMLSPEETNEAWEVISQGFEIKTFDAWIDHQGYLRKAVLAMAFELPESLDSRTVIEFKMEMNLFDYGQDIIIELPAEYEEFPDLFDDLIESPK